MLFQHRHDVVGLAAPAMNGQSKKAMLVDHVEELEPGAVSDGVVNRLGDLDRPEEVGRSHALRDQLLKSVELASNLLGVWRMHFTVEFTALSG